MDIELLDYHLPRELIADRPVPRRDESRLLVLRRQSGRVEHRCFRDLPAYLRAEDVLVLNNTRVVRARIGGRRIPTGGRWSGLFLRELEAGLWLVMATARRRLKCGDELALGEEGSYTLTLLQKQEGGAWLAMVRPVRPAEVVLDEVGQVPLPPYIRRQPEKLDELWYQTVYATEPGAVAAPTAGLHFTTELLETIRSMGVAIVYVTLHVGPGTFRPIKAATVEEHRMHAEWCRVTDEVVRTIVERRARGGRVVAVGTTVVRALETAARSGILEPFDGTTDLFIHPPYRFRAVDVLVTNFHLPRSTLLALVYAFGGIEQVRNAYEEAVRRRYRFYSYGDAMLIL